MYNGNAEFDDVSFAKHYVRSGPKTVFSVIKCEAGKSECVVGIYVMCSSVLAMNRQSQKTIIMGSLGE